MKVIGLIPVRLDSKRLKNKALLKINNLPIFIHTYKRAKLSKLLNDVIICCDDEKLIKISKKYNAKAIITSKNHKNGTERIFEAYTKIKKKYNFIIDIQGDEPLINPKHIDSVINFHKLNRGADIILPSLKFKKDKNNVNIVKVIFNNEKEVLYLSRANLPYEFKKKNKYLYKHLSIISFTPGSLKLFANNQVSRLEKIEGIELLRAIDLGMKIKTKLLKGDSFSVDVKSDYLKAKKRMQFDNVAKIYKKN
jgi:3-deoxy-manno-octulosonate cytidylyltransferase (CMP-KDO synthetase)